MTFRRRVATLLGALCVVLIVAGCATTKSGSALPAPLGPGETADPMVVLRDGFTTMFGWRPALDASPDDAYARAYPYLTGALRDSAGESAGGGSKARWKAWAEANAKVTVTVRVATDEHPPDRADRVDRVVLVGQAITGADAKPIDTIEMTVWASVVKTDQGWRIDGLRF